MNDPQGLTKRQAKASKAGKASAKKRWGARLPEKILRDEFNKALILLPEGMILNFNNGEYQAPTLVAFEKACGIFADKINAIIDYLNSKEGEEK